MTRRVGFFGGSFDPPHNAHLALARLARDHLQLDELRIVVAGQPWQKAAQAMTPAEHRLAMTRLAFAGEPRMAIETWEVDHPEATVTADTLEALQARADGQGAEWFLVLGQDQYGRLDTWRRWPDLLSLATLAVAGRAGAPPQPPDALAAVPHRVVALPLAPMATAATALREAVAAGMGIAGEVPPAVASYIDRHALYRAAPPEPHRS
ncbi:nicotinate (nicotinamide) nucleotide adenylyltransferase [Aquabacterium sp. J223]|uniref:nicotinate (nicotinamide) nucleotide adenylyltransferase n=1 Tax=Aquabacterium sp. J223 TaxID=2898431 RepID=UPI0021ADA634|nr:nicotinate (nicotinamide) nucleotide adenylyltransferase [Aquabacterium sp. J223]UUX94695.1 nicotinate (nicotinamide) nucleotide adenylyltransferase [Aquabacterium sp. J223]